MPLMLWNLWYFVDYFVLLPLMSLFPLPFAYRLARLRGRVRAWWNPSHTAVVATDAKQLLGKHGSADAIRYLEIVSCDELDAYLFLLKPFRCIKKYLHVEGEGYLEEVKRRGKGAVLLGAHFGGALLSNPFLRLSGFVPQLIMRPLAKEEFHGPLLALYFYFRFRGWCVARAVGARPLMTGKGMEEAVEATRQGTFLWIALDVPPPLMSKSKQAIFFDRPARFPYGPFAIAERAEVPVLPFFTSVDDNNHRTLRFRQPIWLTTPEAGEKAFHDCVRLLEEEIRARPSQWFFWGCAGTFFDEDIGGLERKQTEKKVSLPADENQN